MNPVPIDPSQKNLPSVHVRTDHQDTLNNTQTTQKDNISTLQGRTRSDKLDLMRAQIAQGAYLTSAEAIAKQLVDGGFLD